MLRPRVNVLGCPEPVVSVCDGIVADRDFRVEIRPFGHDEQVVRLEIYPQGVYLRLVQKFHREIVALGQCSKREIGGMMQHPGIYELGTVPSMPIHKSRPCVRGSRTGPSVLACCFKLRPCSLSHPESS